MSRTSQPPEIEEHKYGQADSHDIVINDVFGLAQLGAALGASVLIFTIAICIFASIHGSLVVEVIRKLAGLP
ncbi:hypothetical protein UFOVP1382_8 [uncultured Caudovirales phage]|uniref:Uncharacterized protein n=1 Tax=uncultured Caudovirales phage TaxID=2100421 RepID=A0A6J5S0D8_9CAUD|nr:hypothetical protein UFOVP1382_8 [uncultured Caudovirales phage]